MTDEAIILVIDDEPEIRRFLRVALATQHWEVVEAADGALGVAAAATRNPDVVVLDLGLPDIDGIDVVKRLREWSNVPIVVLSARGREADKVAALDAGADDYLTKPFGVGELLARLRVALRRRRLQAGTSEDPVVVSGDLTIDVAAHRIAVKDREIKLTPIEFRLLAELARHRGRVLTHRHLLESVWGPAYVGQSHYLRIYMGQLRKKIEADTARPKWLITEPGVGYRLE